MEKVKEGASKRWFMRKGSTDGQNVSPVVYFTCTLTTNDDSAYEYCRSKQNGGAQSWRRFSQRCLQEVWLGMESMIASHRYVHDAQLHSHSRSCCYISLAYLPFPHS